MKAKNEGLVPQCLFYLLFFILTCPSLSGQVSVSEQQWVLPTNMVEAPDRNPIFFNHESYQGASKVVYPYMMNDVISDKRKDHAWKALVLENEYIKLCVTPEIGGKLYYATDKSNGYNFIYKNDVVKPSNIGMFGAWVSGGIEWCVLHHHRASTFLPVDYEIKENEDGSKTIWVGETEPRQRMRWTISITAFPGKSYFRADVKIINPLPSTHTFLYWANVAAHTGKDYQVIFPPSVQVAAYHAKNSFTHWPVSTDIYNGEDYTSGVDLSWWKNSPNWNSFFAYDLKEDFMGGYDHEKETGTVHIGDHNIIKGAKLWEWGSGPQGQGTEARLTDKAGPYVEIMTGAFSDNQPDYSWIMPYEVKTFSQYWYPVKDIQGFKNANLNGALNLEKRDNAIFIGFCAAQKFKSIQITLKKNDKVIFKQTMGISPEKAFIWTVDVHEQFSEADLLAEVRNVETGDLLISYHPVERKPVDKLPEIVKKPLSPKETPTIEELYLTGSRIQQFHNPSLNPVDYYQEALSRDPDDVRTNTAVGNIFLKNGDYIRARSYFARAIKRLTKDYTRPSNGEALYLQGLTLKALELYDEAIDTLYRATWDLAWHSAAYLELARISSLRGDFAKALDQVNESLLTNTRNNSAICLKAALLRRSGNLEGAMKILESTIKTDPLDFRAGNESYLIANAGADLQKSLKELSLLKVKMRDFDQNYLELATGYINDGLLSEAEDVLLRFTGDNPIVNYYLGYMQLKNGDSTEAVKYFNRASQQSVDYIFPFRLETIKVLETAMKFTPNDAKACYYLGNILYDKQPERAIENWENAVKINPELSIAWRNLGWGYYHHGMDENKAISAYEKAIAINKNDPVYYEELDALYEINNTSVEKRLALFDGSNDVVSRRDGAFARQINVMTLAGKSDKAVEYLTGKDFSYREEGSKIRDVVIDAHLKLGEKYYDEKNFKKALEEFLLAQVQEEAAGEGASDNRNIQVDYFIGRAYEALENKQKAKSHYSLSAGQNDDVIGYLAYYQGLSLLKLEQKERAYSCFNSMITEADTQIHNNTASEADFFAKFGAVDAVNKKMSMAYMLKGLGYKGLGKIDLATENLKKAVALSASNLWAKSELMFE